MKWIRAKSLQIDVPHTAFSTELTTCYTTTCHVLRVIGPFLCVLRVIYWNFGTYLYCIYMTWHVTDKYWLSDCRETVVFKNHYFYSWFHVSFFFLQNQTLCKGLNELQNGQVGRFLLVLPILIQYKKSEILCISETYCLALWLLKQGSGPFEGSPDKSEWDRKEPHKVISVLYVIYFMIWRIWPV